MGGDHPQSQNGISCLSGTKLVLIMQEEKKYIDCDKAECCCDKGQYKEADKIEKIQLLEHLAECPRCREYSEKNTRLTELIEKAKKKFWGKKKKKKKKKK